MRLTHKQSLAVDYDGNLFLEASPGSGKTRTLVAKMIKCLDAFSDTPRKIGCITYTNAGVHEIEDRVRREAIHYKSGSCEISTIHSFCLNNILLYYHWNIEKFKNGFKVLPPDSDTYKAIRENVIHEFGIDMSKSESFEMAQRSIDGKAIINESDTIKEAIQYFWSELDRRNFVDFTGIVYYSYLIIHNHPFVARALSARFAWLLIDEFQDTSVLQVEILRSIASNNITKFFLVGDPYQTIMGFAGSRPDLMDAFQKEIASNATLQLDQNFRSSQLIVDTAELLLPRSPRMIASGENKNFTASPLWYKANNSYEGIINIFLPELERQNIALGKAAILAPSWFVLSPLGKKMRQPGISISGPGARPYKRSHLLTGIIEQICLTTELKDFSNRIPKIERELFYFLVNLKSNDMYRAFTYSGRIAIHEILFKAFNFLQQNMLALPWLTLIGQSIGKILLRHDFIFSDNIAIIDDSIKDIIDDIRNDKYLNAEALTVHELGLFASTQNSLKLLTMHKSKGREFDAVALIEVHDGKIPFWKAVKDNDINSIEESKRLLYVAITRAKKVLYIFTDTSSPKNIPSRFLAEIIIESDILKMIFGKS